MVNLELRRVVFLGLLLTFPLSLEAQNLKDISNFETEYQACLDKGIDMQGCSVSYYQKSDSLLNVVYKQLKLKLNLQEQSVLRSEQKKWLVYRDIYFKKAYLEAKKENGDSDKGHNFIMFLYDKKMNYVLNRVKELSIRLEKLR